MFELGQRYKIFFRPGVEAPIEGYNGSDPSKYYAIGTFVGMDNSGRIPFVLFRDVKMLNPYTQTYRLMNEFSFQDFMFSDSPIGRYQAVKVNPESGLPMSGGRRRRSTTRRPKRKALRSKRGSRKH